MATRTLRGFLQCDTEGNLKEDSNGNINCIIEDGNQLKFPKNKINLSSDTLTLIIDGKTQLCIDLPKKDIPKRRKIYDDSQNEQNQNDENNDDQNDQNDFDHFDHFYHFDHFDQNDQNDPNDPDRTTTLSKTSSSWYWNEASTKLLLDIYKQKKNLVSTRKIKTYKLLWKQIAEDIMLQSRYVVTPLQVENKIKSLERSYKNMISNNKMTGRARKTCKYETELTDLLGEKHSIEPLAVSGRNGLILREQSHSNKENNAVINNVIDNPEDVDNNSSNTPENNVQTLNRDKLQINTNRVRQNTTSALINKYQATLDAYISENNNKRRQTENIQTQILEEFKNIKKIQEDFVHSAKKQWALSNVKRDENIRVLKQIANSMEQIATFSYKTNI